MDAHAICIPLQRDNLSAWGRECTGALYHTDLGNAFPFRRLFWIKLDFSNGLLSARGCQVEYEQNRQHQGRSPFIANHNFNPSVELFGPSFPVHRVSPNRQTSTTQYWYVRPALYRLSSKLENAAFE